MSLSYLSPLPVINKFVSNARPHDIFSFTTSSLSSFSTDPVIIEAECSFEYVSKNIWDGVGITHEYNERRYKFQVLDSSDIGEFRKLFV